MSLIPKKIFLIFSQRLGRPGVFALNQLARAIVVSVAIEIWGG